MNLAENPEALGLGEFLTAFDIKTFEAMPLEGPCNSSSLDTHRVCVPYSGPFSRRCEPGETYHAAQQTSFRAQHGSKINYVLVLCGFRFEA